MELEMIVSATSEVFKKHVNDFIKKLEEDGKKYKATFQSNPWYIDGQGGVEHCAYIFYECGGSCNGNI